MLDQRGKRCPAPVIELARRVVDVPVGALVVVLSDDPAAATDIPAWCGLKGHELVGSEPLEDGGAAYSVRRTA